MENNSNSILTTEAPVQTCPDLSRCSSLETCERTPGMPPDVSTYQWDRCFHFTDIYICVYQLMLLKLSSCITTLTQLCHHTYAAVSPHLRSCITTLAKLYHHTYAALSPHLRCCITTLTRCIATLTQLYHRTFA